MLFTVIQLCNKRTGHHINHICPPQSRLMYNHLFRPPLSGESTNQQWILDIETSSPNLHHVQQPHAQRSNIMYCRTICRILYGMIWYDMIRYEMIWLSKTCSSLCGSPFIKIETKLLVKCYTDSYLISYLPVKIHSTNTNHHHWPSFTIIDHH